MKNKYVLLISLIFLILFSQSIYAYEEKLYCSFESESEASEWPGTYFDDGNVYSGVGAGFVSNPFGEETNSLITHVLEYSGQIYLEAGKTYTLSGAVMNPLSGYSPSIEAHATLEPYANTVIVDVYGIGDEWSEFSTNFYASETGYYNLALHLKDGNVDFGFYVDEILLAERDLKITSLNLIGPDSINIPAEGVSRTRYLPVFKSSDGTIINILTNDTIHFSTTTAQGVYFESSDMCLEVYHNAIPDTIITIDCTLKNFENLTVSSINVILTNNLLENSSFDKGNTNWISLSTIDLNEGENNFISVPTNDYSTFGYYTTLMYDKSLVLVEDALYVLHARVKSDSYDKGYSLYAKNTSFIDGDTVVFNITDISGNEWTDVFAAFIPENTGIYNLAVNFSSTYDCTLFIDDIRMCVEELQPTYLTLHAPGNILVPDNQTSFTLSALMRDQLGNIIEGEEIVLSLDNTNPSVQFDSSSNTLTVSPDAPVGEYTLRASSQNYPEITSELPITISFDFIGDGSFERKSVNEWWVVTSPYNTNFTIRDDGSTKKAHINCDGEYFILLNNSYVLLTANTPYVFNIEAVTSQNATITAFIEDMDGNSHPLVQFNCSDSTENLSPELFLSEKNIVGRLFFYVQTTDSSYIQLALDNISLRKSIIKATNPHVSGQIYVNGYAHAEFNYYNSITNSTQAVSPVINWYIGDSPNGEFTQLDESSRYIYFDTNYDNKYVYFDITPVCNITGFSGETVKCTPFKVIYSEDQEYTPPKEIEDVSSIPVDSEPNTTPPPVTEGVKTPFKDVGEHWAAEYIKFLSDRGIVSGNGDGMFFPNSYITRAEAAKLISLAFSIKTKNQTNKFSDVSVDSWYNQYVTALYDKRIASGTSDNLFSPNKNITREEFAVFAIRIYNLLHDKEKPSPPIYSIFINDGVMISDWAVDSVNLAVSLRIIEGNSESCFLPKNFTTRGEAAAIIYRLYNLIK
ncbi:MAG: S-layer homology domain-containing protein [Clostridia bacterium]|nr:S-layer homology domain-containing protein [Clostridia bacterium]